MTKTIAIFRTGGIGDIILSTVSINIIKENIADAKIIWFGRAAGNSLIKKIFADIDVQEIRAENSYSENLLLIKKSAASIDIIIDLQHSARTVILGHLAAMHFNCSYTSWNKYSIERSLLVIQSRIKGRIFQFDLFRKNLPNRHETMAACTIKALRKSGIRAKRKKTYTPEFFSNKIPKENSIAICLGARFKAKALSPEIVEKIIEQIIADKQCDKVSFLGDADQRPIGEYLSDKYSSFLDIHNLCGQTTLAQAADILRKSKFAIANDSGLAHLSEATGTPVLMFFGPTHQKFGYRPYLEKSETISADLGCRPCNKNGDVKCRYADHACAAFINTSQVSGSLTRLGNG